MRSRYCAYAMGLVDYIIDTTDPAGPVWQTEREEWEEQVRQFSTQTAFRGLQVVDHSEQGDAGMVSFTAELSRDGHDVSFGEKSRFTRRDGRWLYHSGVPNG